MPLSKHLAHGNSPFSQDLQVQYERLVEELQVCQSHQLSSPDKRQSALSHFKAEGTSSGGRNGCRNGFHSAAGISGSFTKDFQAEFDRILEGLRVCSEELLTDAFSVAEHLSSEGQDRASSMSGSYRALQQIGEKLIYLDGCIREDALMFARLAECWDAGCQPPGPRDCSEGSDDSHEDDVNALYVECFSSKLQAKAQSEQLLITLSDMFARLRNMEKGACMKAGVWVPPTRFTRDTTKFWLKPENVMKFKVQLVKHLPVLIFDRKGETSGTILESLQNLKAENLRDWTTVSSVYLDDEEMQNYMSRLRRDDKATAIRVRFYGQRITSGDQQLFLERKTHREKWTGETSCKERCEVRQAHMEPLLASGRLPPNWEPHGRDGAFASEVVEQIQATGQKPLLRTVCDRTAFQETSTDMIRISLDTHLHMIKENPDKRPPGAWCRDESTKMEEDEVLHFPYAVVEVKLQMDGYPPWLQELVDSGVLIHTPRFSKYLHGVAGLFEDKVDRLPYWFLQNADGSMSPATWDEMAAEEQNDFEKDAAPWLFPKNDEQPLLGKVMGFFGGKKLQSSPSLEARADQSVVDLQKARAMQARDELQSVNGSQASFLAISPTTRSTTRKAEGHGGSFAAANGLNVTSREPSLAGNPPLIPPLQGPGPSDIEAQVGHRDKLGLNHKGTQRKNVFSRLMRNFKKDDKSGAGEKQEEGRSKTMFRSRVEPKTFFANERTFLQWLNISVLIMLTGLSLLGGTFSSVSGGGAECGSSSPGNNPSQFSCKGSKYAGLVISPIAVLFMVYALFMYQKRTIQIMHQRRAVRYDDQKGPILLVVLLVTALIVAMAFTANAAFNS